MLRGPVPEAQWERLRNLAAQGLCAAEIAARMGVTENAIRARASRRDIALVPAQNRVDRDALRHLHGKGLSGKQIAKELGCSQRVVSCICQELGLRFRPHIDAHEVLRLADQGLKAPAIARHLGVTQYRVYRILNTNSIRRAFSKSMPWFGAMTEAERRDFLTLRQYKYGIDEALIAIKRPDLIPMVAK